MSISAKLAKNNFAEIRGLLRQRTAEKVNLAMQHAATVAKHLCPISHDEHKDGTPHMRDTIVLETYRNGELVRLHVKAPYAAFVERGHHSVDGTWVPGKPFLHPAIESAKRELSKIQIQLVGYARGIRNAP